MTFEKQSSYSREELIECGKGKLFGPGNAQLPLPPMLMFNRIVNIAEGEGTYGKGQVIAELDVTPDLWFFECHFEGDPVMPGCLGLDAMWQLTGFFLGWSGGKGRGRALGVGEVKFTGMVLQTAKKATYRISIKRMVMRGNLVMGISDGILSCDGEPIFGAKDMRVTVFTSTEGS